MSHTPSGVSALILRGEDGSETLVLTEHDALLLQELINAAMWRGTKSAEGLGVRIWGEGSCHKKEGR